MTKTEKVRWQYDEYVETSKRTGEEVRFRKSGFNSKTEAKLNFERRLADYRKNLEQTNKKNITFEMFFYDKYLPFYEDTGVADSTYNAVISETTNHILPTLGKLNLAYITVSDCQRLVARVKEKRKSFRRLLGFARRILSYALAEGYIDENPMEKVIITPSKKKYKNNRVEAKDNYYTPEQMMVFLEYYKKHGHFHEFVYFRLLAFSGLRRSEALALYVTDIDHTNKSISVSKTLSQGKNKRTKLSLHTKTSSESSVIYLDEVTYDYLKQLINQINFVCRNGEIELPHRKFIWTSPFSLSHYDKMTPNDWLKGFFNKHKDELNELGLHRISVHGFRHSHSTMLHRLGVNAKDAQHRLRHKNIQTTLDVYTHIDSQSAKDTASLLNNVNQKEESPSTSPSTIVNIRDYFA